MTNRYTSYEVSKQLWDAGIFINHEGFWESSQHYPEKVRFFKGDIKIFDKSVIGKPRETYPAYTAGELIREIQKRKTFYPILSIRQDGYELAFGNGITSLEQYSGIAATPEDCLALAILKLRKEKEDE